MLFGGVDANTFYADTWVWNLSARTWTPLATTASSAAGRPFVGRTFPGATFNPTAGHGVTVFGGIGYPAGSGTVTDFNDIWELRGTVWTDVTPAGGNPPGRGWTQLVWDPLFNRIVMFAGYRVAAPAHVVRRHVVVRQRRLVRDRAAGARRQAFVTATAWPTTPRETGSSSSAGISRTSSSWTARRGRWRCGRTGRRRRTGT